MRCIGSLSDPKSAQQFVDFLSVEGIPATADAGDADKWEIWVKEEDKVERGREELQRFIAAPGDARYQLAGRQARELRQTQQQQLRQARRNLIDVRATWQRGNWVAARLTTSLVVISVVVFVLSMSGGGDEPSMLSRWLQFADPPIFAGGGTSVWRDIASGQIWRLFTPMFLHGDLIHILLNMYLLHVLGSLVERTRGIAFMLMLVLASSALSNALQAQLGGSTNFYGMSGVGYALFGYVWLRGLYDPLSGYRLNNTFVFIMIAVLVMGILVEVTHQQGGFLSGVANWAHLGGFVAGLVIALLQRPR